MGAHALLSPSGAERWINCPKSVRATEHLDDVETDYAAEGTLIHSLAELALNSWIDNEDHIPEPELDTLKSSKYYSEEVQNAADSYVALVKERHVAALAEDPSAQIRIERRVDLSDAVPESFGTADCSIVYNRTLEIVDLKGGRGIYVSAYDNAQTRLYAYGVLKLVEIMFPIEHIKCTICQPRMDSVSEELLTRQQLIDWIDTVARPAAAKAWAGEGEFKAGEWCQWCKIKTTCRARAAQHLGDVQAMFAADQTVVPAAALTPQEIADLLPQLDLVKKWVNEVQAGALTMASAGTEIPGFKLVRGKLGNREYADQETVMSALRGAEIPEAVYMSRALMPPAPLEKTLGKKVFAEVVGPFIARAAGKITLVPETDRREAVNNAAEAAALFKEAADE